MYNDKTLVCKDCGQEFVFSASEQEFYAENGNVSIAIKAQSVSGRFASLSEELAKEAETEDLDVIVVETEAPSDPVSEE